MTMVQGVRIGILAVAMAAAAAPRPAAVERSFSATPQIETGALSNWADLSTWSRPAAGTQSLTEHGIGLVLAGDSGDMRLAFYVVRSNREPAASRPVTQIGVRAAAGLRINPNLIRTPTLALSYGKRGAEPEVIDLSTSMTVDNPAPGAPVASGVGTMSAEGFLAMTDAEQVGADIFGAKVTLRPDQIDALRAFRDRFFPKR